MPHILTSMKNKFQQQYDFLHKLRERERDRNKNRTKKMLEVSIIVLQGTDKKEGSNLDSNPTRKKFHADSFSKQGGVYSVRNLCHSNRKQLQEATPRSACEDGAFKCCFGKERKQGKQTKSPGSIKRWGETWRKAGRHWDLGLWEGEAAITPSRRLCCSVSGALCWAPSPPSNRSVFSFQNCVWGTSPAPSPPIFLLLERPPAAAADFQLSAKTNSALLPEIVMSGKNPGLHLSHGNSPQ